MATSTISNTVTDPSGTAVASVTVVARLMPGPGFRADASEVSGRVTTTTNGSGQWSLALERNANISRPTDSWWEITEQVPDANGGARVWAISVGASNATLLASLTTPSTDTSLASYITQSAADARYLRTAFTLNYVNAVQDYAADNSGATDTTSALNSAVSATDDGGTLYLPAGTYLISGSNTWTIAKRIRLTGAGNGTILRKTGTGDLLVLGAGTTGNQKQGLYVGNLTLATETGAGDALKLKGIHRSLFENVNIPSAAGAGVRLLGSLLNTFVSLKVTTNLPYTVGTGVHPTHGVSLETGETGTGSGGSNSNTFIGPEFAGITTSPGIGFNIDDADGTLLAGGATEGNTVGLKLGTGVHNNVTIGTDFESNGTDVSGTYGNNCFLNTPNVTTYFGSNAQVADGTAPNPSVFFLNDTDTGIYRSGTNEISLAASGQNALAVSNNLITVPNGTNIQVGLANGTKIGTGSGQKLGLWGVTPVVQQVLATGAAHTVDDVISLLQTIGLCKQS